MNTAIALGERKKSDVKKERGGLVTYGPCILCDKPVWGSGKGYTTDDVNADVTLKEKFGEIKVKPLHKWCLAELVEMGRDVMMVMDLKYGKRSTKN